MNKKERTEPGRKTCRKKRGNVRGALVKKREDAGEKLVSEFLKVKAGGGLVYFPSDQRRTLLG